MANKFSELEPLINNLVNPVAAYWLHESGLFKHLTNIANNTLHGHASVSISNSAVARYLHLQLELVESVFMPLNDTIVQCIKNSNNNFSTLASPLIKFFKSATALEHLTSTFMIKKSQYWLGVLLKLKKMLLQASSPYYQVIY